MVEPQNKKTTSTNKTTKPQNKSTNKTTEPQRAAAHLADLLEVNKIKLPYKWNELWQLMKDAMEEAIESFSLDWEWDEGSVDAAQAGSGADQHSYFRPKKKSKKQRKR